MCPLKGEGCLCSQCYPTAYDRMLKALDAIKKPINDPNVIKIAEYQNAYLERLKNPVRLAPNIDVEHVVIYVDFKSKKVVRVA